MVAVDWSCATNIIERRQPTHHPHLGTRGQEKEGETKRDIEAHSGKGITGVRIKILS